MLTMLSIAKLIAEVALMSLAGQWLLGLFAGERRANNVVYQLLQHVGRPFVVAAGWVAPRWVLPRHHAWIAFLLLLLAWLVVTVLKISHCLQMGVQLCR
ncbi:hypothetical protein E5678_07160 [Hydrogenophaga sp. PAMC20947]|nr:hypothetical protein E5678_07160 [Hydrogenophaga sp. PAMC20947]